MKKNILFLFMALYSLIGFASPENNQELSPVIRDIVYDYQMTDEYKTLDCYGTLSFKIDIPAGYMAVIVSRSVKHKLEGDRISFLITTTYDNFTSPTTLDVSLNDISWGCYFKVNGVKSTNEFVGGKTIYCTNSFMDSKDLDAILNQASVDDIEADTADIRTEGSNLIIDVSGKSKVMVNDINGRMLFNGDITQYTEIPLESAKASILVVRLITKDKVITKKIVVK